MISWFKKSNFVQQKPQTNFPTSPKNRWINWTGLLQANDEGYIFTKSVCYYLYKVKFFYVFESYREIDMPEAITLTYNKIKEICKKDDPELRQITKSIKALVEKWVFLYMKHIKKKLYSAQSNLEDFDKVLDNAKYSPTEYFWKKEFYITFQKAIEELSEEEKKVILLKLENKRIEEISRLIGQSRHKTNKIYQTASFKIDNFFKQAGLDVYR